MPTHIPTFQVAFPGPIWHTINAEISKEMFSAFLVNTPGFYTEPVTANGKGGTRRYRVDWDQMIQTNIQNGRRRSVRFQGVLENDNDHILTGTL